MSHVILLLGIVIPIIVVPVIRTLFFKNSPKFSDKAFWDKVLRVSLCFTVPLTGLIRFLLHSHI